MTRPATRPDSSFHIFRKRIPADLRGKVTGQPVLITFPPHGSAPGCAVKAVLGVSEVKFSLRTRDPRIATARSGLAEDHLQRLFAGLRSGPVRLTHKQTIALAGTWYRDFVAALEEDPGEPWVFERLHRAWTSPDLDDPTECLKEAGPLADKVLASHALTVCADSRDRLAFAMRDAVRDAAGTLKRRAEGDYGPDALAQRFPEWAGAGQAPQTHPAGSASAFAGVPNGSPQRAPLGRTSMRDLVAGWWREGQAAGLSRKTHQAYSSAMDRLSEHVGHDDASRITAEDVIGLKDARVAAGISTKTVKDSDLAGLKAVFGWAVANQKLSQNPAVGVTVRRTKQVKLREKDFTEVEATAILGASLRLLPGRERAKTYAAKRWVPWLCAYTGARVGEIAQLRKQDVRQEGHHWVITITPDAGTTKNKEARAVPLHPHLVEMGFPEFVQSSAAGHLFLTPGPSGDILGPLQGVKNRLAEFSRSVVSDKNVAPNHGWRHRFKTVGMDVGVSERVLDAICGHAPRTVGAAYGTVTITAKAQAIAAFPRYTV